LKLETLFANQESGTANIGLALYGLSYLISIFYEKNKNKLIKSVQTRNLMMFSNIYYQKMNKSLRHLFIVRNEQIQSAELSRV
jgi:hypothetical protein